MSFELLKKKSIDAPNDHNTSSNGITQLVYKLDAVKYI